MGAVVKRAVSFLAMGAMLTEVRAANAQPKRTAVDKCLEHFETAQIEHKRSRLVASLEAYQRCTEIQCPSAVRKDCAQGREAIDRAMPTITIIVRGADGQDLNANLRVDGLRFEVGAHAVPIDPGQHTARITLDKVERKTRFTVYEGEKSRVLILNATNTTAEPVEPPPPPPPSQPVKVDDGSPSQSKRSPALPLLLVGGGLIAGIISVVLLGKAADEREKETKEERLRDQTSPFAAAATHQRNADGASAAADLNMVGAAVFGLVTVGAIIGVVVWFVEEPKKTASSPTPILGGTF